MKIALYPNLSKPNAIQTATETVKLLKIMGAEFVDFENYAAEADFILAIGGDGTILRCAKTMLGKSAKIIGINSGTLGFMSTIEKTELAKLKKLFVNDFSISKRMMLKIEIILDGVRKKYHALNEVLFRRQDFKIWSFSVNIAEKNEVNLNNIKLEDLGTKVNIAPSKDGGALWGEVIFTPTQIVGKYRSDGVLFATPTGSTAHAFSAGGPIIEPSCECIEMNLLAPHTIMNRAVIFGKERILSINQKEDGVFFSVDGETAIELNSRAEVYVSRSKYTTDIVNIGDDCFHDTLDSKLFHSLKYN